MLRRVIGVTGVLLLLGCGGDAASWADDEATVQLALAPTSKSLPITWQGQQTGYWCGPGSTRMALTARMSSPPTQTTLANYMGTTVNGTNHIGLVANALNHYLGTSVYVTRNISDPPAAGQQQALQNTIVGSISNGYAMVANVISGWRPPGYPGGTIYHYVAIVGYDQGGARALVADPAAACAAGSGWCNVPKTYWVSISNLATWIGGKGYAGTNLAPKDDAPQSGTLIGAIYQGGNTANRVAGAVVKVGSASVTTGADGLYQFTLAPGSYTASVTKAGYASTQVTRTVTAGTQTWGSMEVTPTATTGTLRGKIFLVNPADASDMSTAVSGATVRIGTQTFTTGADGMYLANLAPGTWEVKASKTGYQDATLSRAVTANTTTWGSVGLSAASAPDTQAPQVAITSPAAGASLDVARVRLTGTASDDRGAISEVKVSLNGGAPVAVPVSAGAFDVEMKLSPGANTVVATARDAAGHEARAERQARFAAGLTGHATLDSGEARAGALAQLLDDAGNEAARTSTDAEGRFDFDVTLVPMDGVVVVSAEGLRTAREAVHLDDEQRATLSVTMLAGVDEGVSTQGPGDGEQGGDEPTTGDEPAQTTPTHTGTPEEAQGEVMTGVGGCSATGVFDAMPWLVGLAFALRRRRC